jgi:hypothetical protein
MGKKKASRSKSVSNLQALFNPMDDSSLTLSAPAVAPTPAAFEKENSEISLKYDCDLPVQFSSEQILFGFFLEKCGPR